MIRRNVLKAAGASVVAGNVLAGSVAADEKRADEPEDDATEDGPRIVSFEYEHDRTDDRGAGYSVDYEGNGQVTISGRFDTPTPCYDGKLEGIESTDYGDVVQVRAVRNDADLCIQVVSRIHYELELEYENGTEPDNVLVDQGVPDWL